MNFGDIKAKLEKRGIAPAEYEEAYGDLISRIEDTIKAHAKGEWGEARRITQYALVLRQSLLHRAVKLFEGAFDALINDNGYSMALSIRGHFETTAAIGYLHNRLYSLQQGSLNPVTVDRNIMTQLMGTRDEKIIEKASQLGLEAKQILNMLEYADKSVSKQIMQGSSKDHAILMDSYKFLCEFSHPNFHSNTLAFTLNKEEEEFLFMHNKAIREQDAALIGYLLISSPILIDLYDSIEELLPSD